MVWRQGSASDRDKRRLCLACGIYLYLICVCCRLNASIVAAYRRLCMLWPTILLVRHRSLLQHVYSGWVPITLSLVAERSSRL